MTGAGRPRIPMRLRHIELFHAVMQAGSLSGAAAALGIAQPSASKMLAGAEADLGLLLFVRRQGSLRPTPEALALFEQTKRFQQSLDQVRRVAGNLAEHPGGRLRIGCIPSLGLNLIPRAVAGFQPRFPEVMLEIRTHHAEELCAQLLRRDLDIAIAFDPGLPPGIRASPLGRARVVYLPPAGAPPPAGPVRLEDLPAQGWIGIGREDPLGRVLAAALEARGLGERAPAMEVRTYYLAQALVDCGLGHAVVDEFTAAARPGAPLHLLQPPLSIGVFALGTPDGQAMPAFGRFAAAVAALLPN
ncbi:LysR family transcriptional regulator [Roseomonas sp. USHLN139]|uniref:LysR family transcriptional regulator n=1 Tax=Roseomonas sp. USHLN139 TaxID=3081298 RepID=UPI003B01AE73